MGGCLRGDCGIMQAGGHIGGPLEFKKITEVGPILRPEGILVDNCSVIVEAPRPLTFDFYQFNGSKMFVSVAMMPRFLTRAEHHDALIFAKRKSIIKANRDWVVNYVTSGRCSQIVGGRLPRVDYLQPMHKAPMGFVLLLYPFSFNDDVGAQLPSGGILSAINQPSGGTPQKDSRETKDSREGSYYDRAKGNPKLIMRFEKADKPDDPGIRWLIVGLGFIFVPGAAVVIGGLSRNRFVLWLCLGTLACWFASVVTLLSGALG